MSAIKPRSSSSSRSARVRLVVLFSRKRESSKERKSARLHERERERNDPFEPDDDDDDDAKISLTFFHTQDYTHCWAHARAQKKTERDWCSSSSSLSRLSRAVVSSGVKVEQHVTRERLHRQILFFFLARKKKHLYKP